MKIFGREIKFPTFKSYNTMIGSTLRATNSSIVSPQRQLTGEFPPLSALVAFQYYYGWDQIKASIDVAHQKFWGRGMEIKSKNEAFNTLVKKWMDIANGEQKISEAIYSLLITGDFFIEKQFAPDGRMGNIAHVPMTTIYRIFRDQYANELKVVQLVDGIYKELDPENLIHCTINNPTREAFGHSEFHTLAAPRPIAGELDPLTGEPINPQRNLRSLLDAQAILQNAEVEIKMKMAKPRILVSAQGMPQQQMLAIQKEMADPANDQWIWIFDRPITSTELAVNGQTKFDSYGDNVDAHIDIGTGFASNVIKNPSGFSYASSQTPLDVQDQKMMVMQGEVAEKLRDELFKPLAISWGFTDVDEFEIEVQFLPTIKRLLLDEINSLDKNAVSPKELRKLYKDQNIALDDTLYEEWQNDMKQQKSEIAKQNFEQMNGGGTKKDGKKPPTDPDSPLTKDKPLFQSETPTPPRTDSRESLREIINETVTEAINRYLMSPKSGTQVHSDLLSDDQEQLPQITDPDVLDAYGLTEDGEYPTTDLHDLGNTPLYTNKDTDINVGDNTNNRFTNTDNIGIDQIRTVSRDDYEMEKNNDTKSEEESDPNLPHNEFKNNEKNRINGITFNDKKKKLAEANKQKTFANPVDLGNDTTFDGDATAPVGADGYYNEQVIDKKPKDDERQTFPNQQIDQPKTVTRGEYEQELNKPDVVAQNNKEPVSDLEQADHLTFDRETGRNYTNVTDEFGNKDPDLRIDQTPDSDEDQPKIKRAQKTVSRQDFEKEKIPKVSKAAFKKEAGEKRAKKTKKKGVKKRGKA